MPLVRPVVRIRHQIFPQRILPHVGQLLLVFEAITHSMVKRFPLPLPRLLQMPAAELSFPKLDPLVYVEMQIVRRAKEMQVIRHEQVIADEPGRRFLGPDFGEGIVDGGIGHPLNSVLGVDRDEENVRLAKEDMSACRRGMTSDVWITTFSFAHAQKVCVLRGEGKRKAMVRTRSTASHFNLFGTGDGELVWDAVERDPYLRNEIGRGG